MTDPQTPAGGALVPAKIEKSSVRHAKLDVGGVEIAYREAGDPSRPTLVLFHGFPTSSHMFRRLIPRLAPRYHVLAPDYPAFGASAMPPPEDYEYSFASLARTMEAFLAKKDVARYFLYAMDYAAPVSFRLFTAHPERVRGFVIQNGNAYEEGLQGFWDPFRAFWKQPSPDTEAPLRGFLELEAQIWQYTHGVPEAALPLVSPDNWHHDQFLLDRPGAKDIQMKLFRSYATNLEEYPKWQAALREHQPPALIVWGAGDQIFPPAGASPYTRDLSDVELHLLDAGHFVLETHLDFVAERTLAFLDRTSGDG